MVKGALRRVVPAGYTVCSLELQGTTPLLMSSSEYDREADTYRSYRELITQRSKSEEQNARIREIEWYLRFYYDPEIGPFVPGKSVKEMVRSAATKFKKGEDVKRSLIVPDYRIPLLYDGPRDLASLWEQGYRYTTMVRNAGVNRGMTERTRPCFDNWSLRTTIAFDPEDLDYSLLETIVKRTEKYGLCDYRPEFGAFVATFAKLSSVRASAVADGVTPMDERAKKANDVFVARITKPDRDK